MGRRDLLRIQAEVEVHFKTFDQFFKEYTKNISKGGMFIKSDNPLPSQTVLEVKLFLPSTGQTITAIGEVVHVMEPEIASERGWDPGMGIHFVDFAETMQQALENYIENQAEKKPLATDERRKHQRRAIRMKVKFLDLTTLRENYAKDISQGGIFIPTSDPKPVGVVITFTLIYPDSGEEIEMDGEVVRVITEKEAQEQREKKLVPGMGVKFINLNGEQQSALGKLLAVESPIAHADQ